MGREMGLSEFPLRDPKAIVVFDQSGRQIIQVPGQGSSMPYGQAGVPGQRSTPGSRAPIAGTGGAGVRVPPSSSSGVGGLPANRASFGPAVGTTPPGPSKLAKFGKGLARVAGPVAGLMVINEIIQSARTAKQESWAQGVQNIQNLSQMVDTDAMSASYMADQMSLAATVAEGKAAMSDSGEYARMLANNMPLLQMLTAPPREGPQSNKMSMVRNTLGI